MNPIRRFAALLPAAALIPALAFSAAAADVKLAVIAVGAGNSPREDVPVSADVAPVIGTAARPLRLVEILPDAKRNTPFQADPADPGRIWFTPPGRIDAGTTRTFELLESSGAQTAGESRSGVEMRNGPDGLDAVLLTPDGSPARVFRYNHSYVPLPSGVKADYYRNGYIHPMFSPSGRLVTEDFPGDHLHHKGVWFPWTETEYEGHKVDFWNIGDRTGTVRHAGFKGVWSGPVFGGFSATHEHVDMTQGREKGGKIALTETWEVRVWSAGGPSKGYWVWDLVSTQMAVSSTLHLKQYRYGGLGFRGAREWKGDNYKALSSEGKTHLDGHMTRAKWCDHGGKIDDKWTGVLIMDHPSNFRFPQSMRLWDKGGAFFCYSPVQLGEFDIKPGEPYVSRYRFVIHDGDMRAEEANRFWEDWGNPPKVTVAAP